MKINDAFPSTYISANDITKPTTVTIKHCSMELVGTGHDAKDKLVLGFENAKKGMVLNKTNAMSIADLHGDDTDRWIGQSIELYSTQVTGPNGLTRGVRVRPPPGHTGPTHAEQRDAGQTWGSKFGNESQGAKTPDPSQDFDDDIPF